MTGGKWANAVIHRDDGTYRGGVMRTLGGARVDTQACPHEHPTWTEARFCAGLMEAHKAGQHKADVATCPLCLFAPELPR